MLGLDDVEEQPQSQGAREPERQRAKVLADKMASLPVVPGHEGFVQPASYLRSRGQSQPMTPAKPKPESAVDRDQRLGLVSSDPCFQTLPRHNITSAAC